MAITVPTTAFDPTKTISPKKAFVTLTPSVAGTPGTPVTLVGKVANYEQTIETTPRDVPDADGYLRPDRIIPKRRTQTFKFEVEDVKALAGAFTGTGIDGGLTTGTAELFWPDPQDASGKIALHSGVFKANWQLDGGLNLAVGDIAKATIKIDSLEKVTLTPDAVLTS